MGLFDNEVEYEVRGRIFKTLEGAQNYAKKVGAKRIKKVTYGVGIFS